MKKVSVIVPVYNVESYLKKCLNSLVNQTLEDIEILVVNDGSPDNSEQIIKEYEEKYPTKIIYFKKPNGGLSDARNYGLKHASGEYIGFVDSDDYVELDMFEKLYNKAKTKDFDLVICDVKNIYPDRNKEENIDSNLEHDLFTRQEIKNNMIYIYPVAWNKLYKRTLFNDGILFKKNVWFEDVEFIFRLYPFLNSIGVIKENLINYVQHPKSITKTYDERLFHYVENWNGILKYYQEKNLYNEYYSELEYSYVRYLYATFIKQASKYKDDEMFNKAVNTAFSNVNINFPNYKKNKYLKKMTFKNIYIKYFSPSLAKLLRVKFKGSE